MRIRDGNAMTTWNRITSPMVHSLQSEDYRCYCLMLVFEGRKKEHNLECDMR